MMLTLLAILALLACLPLAGLNDWFGFIKRQEPLAHALTIASHGVVMVLVAGGAIYYLQDGYIRKFPAEYRSLVYAAFAFVAVWGAYWFFIGAARSRQRRDYHYLGRAVAKVALGFGLYYVFPHYWHAIEVWEAWVQMASVVVASWCVITGVTKIALLMRPLPRLDLPTDRMPDAQIGTGDGIRGS